MASKAIQNEYYPDEVSHPGATILDFLEEKEMSQTQLAERMGRPQKTINELIHGKASITPKTAIELERALGAPANFWQARQSDYDRHQAVKADEKNLTKMTDWAKKFPINEMAKLGWIQKSKSDVEKTNALLMYLGVFSAKEWKTVWNAPQASFRESPAFRKSPEATSVWLRQGEIIAQERICADFNRDVFTDTLKKIRGLTALDVEGFESDLVHLCSKAGVALVFVPPLKGVSVYGVTRWLSPTKVLIQLSLRGRYEDLFWFTFFHECGHVLKHGKKKVFLESNNTTSKEEVEADEFARDFLIPMDKWQSFLRECNYRYFSKNAVVTFAKKVGINPAIVVGRLQHEKHIPQTNLNGLRRKFKFVK